MQTKPINQLDFVDGELSSFVSHLETSYLDQAKGAFIVTANPEIGFEAMQNPRYETVLSSADFILPDGIGVVMVSKLIGRPLQSRIAGYDLFTSLLDKAHQKKKRVFFTVQQNMLLSKQSNESAVIILELKLPDTLTAMSRIKVKWQTRLLLQSRIWCLSR